MSTNVTVNTNFQGVEAKELFLSIFKNSDTISKGLITVNPNVLGSYFLPKLTYSSEMKAVTGCEWLPGGAISLAEKEVTTKKYHISNELCKEDFAKTFQAKNGGLFSANSDMPSDIKEGILLMMVEDAGAVIDKEIWQGTGVTNSFSGLLGQFAADSDVVKVVGATAITATNVLDKLDAVDDLVKPELDGEADLVWIVSRNVAKAYKRSLRGQGINTSATDYELDYNGVRMEVVNGLPNNTIAVYRVKNLHFATGLESDMSEVIVEELSKIEGKIRHQIKFNAGVGYVDGTEIVLYKA